MKGWSTVLAALALTLSLLLATCSTRAKAEVRPSIQVQHSLPSSKKTTSSSPQALKGLRAKNGKNLSKKVDSSFRRIPPSKSNPTQNKFNPPAYG